MRQQSAGGAASAVAHHGVVHLRVCCHCCVEANRLDCSRCLSSVLCLWEHEIPLQCSVWKDCYRRHCNAVALSLHCK